MLWPVNKVVNDIENYFLKFLAYLLYHQYNCLKTKIESFVIKTKENLFFEYYTLSMRWGVKFKLNPFKELFRPHKVLLMCFRISIGCALYRFRVSLCTIWISIHFIITGFHLEILFAITDTSYGKGSTSLKERKNIKWEI